MLVDSYLLKPYGDLQSVDGHIAHFIVPQETLTQTISKLLANFEIVDLTVTALIEDVIRRVFDESGDGLA